ncbi:MAG: hypothetical protein AAGI70_06970, partial [Pseudomonadota bacterium]
ATPTPADGAEEGAAKASPPEDQASTDAPVTEEASDAPVEEAPAEEATSEEVSSEEVSAEENAAEEAPAEESVTDETATDEALTDEAPLEETAVQEPLVEEPPVEEPAAETPPPAPEPAEASGSSFASTALMLLILIIVVSGVTLWGAPKLAPYLPNSVAQYLSPPLQGVDEEVDALKSRIARLEAAMAGNAELAARLSSLEEEGVTPAEDGVAANDALERAEYAQAASEAVASSVTVLATEMSAKLERLEGLDTKVASLEEEIQALSGALSSPEEGAPVSSELQAALEGLRARVDGLASEVGKIPELVTRDEAEAFATQSDLTALGEELSAVASDESALSAAQLAIREAALRGAAKTLRSQINGGLAYDGALTEIETLSGVAAPAALKDPSRTGVPTAAALKIRFAPLARQAIEAEQLSGSDNAGDSILAWFSSQVSTRPTVPTAGDGVPETLSRVEAHLRAEDLTGALAEAETLSEAAQTGLGAWLDALTARVAAEAALPDYLASIGDQQ